MYKIELILSYDISIKINRLLGQIKNGRKWYHLFTFIFRAVPDKTCVEQSQLAALKGRVNFKVKQFRTDTCILHKEISGVILLLNFSTLIKEEQAGTNEVIQTHQNSNNEHNILSITKRFNPSKINWNGSNCCRSHEDVQKTLSICIDFLFRKK